MEGWWYLEGPKDVVGFLGQVEDVLMQTCNTMKIQGGVNFFSLFSRRVFGPSNQHPRCWDQNTSQMQILLASHLKKQKG